MQDIATIRGTTGIDHIPELVLPDGVWTVDPQRSEIGFAVKMLGGLQTVRGVFHVYEGSLEVRAGAGAGELRVEADSLDTGQGRRDRHLRSSDFFDVERHPQIVFTATAVTASDGGLAVTGELAIASSRVRLEIPVDCEQAADGALRLDARTTVSRRAAGVAWNKLGMIHREAVLHARLTLTPAVS